MDKDIQEAAAAAAHLLDTLLDRLKDASVTPGVNAESAGKLFPYGITTIEAEISFKLPAAIDFTGKLKVSGPTSDKPQQMEAANSERIAAVEEIAETREPLLEAVPRAQPVAFKVKRHERSEITDEEAKRILAGGVELLAADDGDDDVSCAVVLTVDGKVCTFDVGDGTIHCPEDLAAVCEQVAGRVLVVNEINYCPRSEGLLPYYGCACASREKFLVVRTHARDVDEEASLWMHEYGHNCGLEHRNSPGTLMHKNLTVDNRRIDKDECAHFQGTNRNPISRSEPSQDDEADLLTFIRGTYIHGVPYISARRFDAAAVPVLLKALRDRKQARQWANAAAVVCYIGDADAATELLKFIQRGNGLLDRAEYQAKLTATVGLGIILNRHENLSSAFQFLEDAFAPGGWPERIQWRNPSKLNAEEQVLHLRKLAAWGLALSGVPRGANVLRELLGTDSRGLTEPNRTALGGLLEECLKHHAQIADAGLEEYYAESGARW